MRKTNAKCYVCGKELYIRPNRLKTSKTGVFSCGGECKKIMCSKRMKGTNNHQYGLKGEKNASYKNGIYKNVNGYVEILNENHPYKNKRGYILQHRAIVEENYYLFDQKYFFEYKGKIYLKKEIEVHHINEIRDDNRIENLIPVTPSEHVAIHNNNYEMKRNNKGQFLKRKRKINIKVIKQGLIPTLATEGSNGFDCYARLDNPIVIHNGERELINLGVAFGLPKGYYIDVRGRSGLTKKGIDIGFGLVDSDYRGEIKACVINNSGEDFKIDNGYKICQIVCHKAISNLRLNLVDELDITNRGSNGFGSSGI